MALPLLWCAPALAQGSARRKVAILWGGPEQPPFDGHVAELVSEIRRIRTRDDVQFDIRWGNNDPSLIERLAMELVSRNPEVIVCGPSVATTPMLRAAKRSPVVFVIVSDPLRRGIVTSLSRPSGNATGFANQDVSVVGKWIQILRDLVPGIDHVGLLISVQNLVALDWLDALQEEAARQGLRPVRMLLHASSDLETHLEQIKQKGALIVPGDTVVSEPKVRDALIASVNSRSIPTLYGQAEFVTSGGLISYDFDKGEQFLRAASYVSRLLDGETISNLPVQAPSRYRLTFNMSVARKIGLTPPSSLLALADEVIE